MADNILVATKNDVNGAHQQVVQEFLDGTGAPIAVSTANPLPVLASISTAGLATSTGQTAGNNSLTSIDGKTPALGQALITASTPVVLPASQVTALTPPAAITGFATEATAAALNGKIPSGLVVTTGRLQVELPAGGGGLTNAELRLTPVPISGNLAVSNFPATQPVSAAALPLPTGAATEGGNLATIKTNTDKIPALGQALAVASVPIVLTAIQQAALTPPAAISGFNLEATQLLVKAKTDNIPAPGQALAAASLPVVLPAAQITALTPPAAITGFALAANQQTNALTDTQIRATALPVSGTFFQATQPVSGTVSTGLSQPLTDTQLRTTPVPVSGTVVTGGLTDTQIRATPLPISGTVSANATLSAETTKVIGTVNVAGTVPISGTVVTGGLTDTQIRATALPVSIASDADNTSTGTLALAAQTVVLTMGGKSAVGIVITGTWVGTITFEGTVDGTNFNPINAVAASTSTPQSTTTVNGLFRLTPAGLLQVRVIMTAFTSGTATVSMRASAGTGGVFANQVVPTMITELRAATLAVTGTAASGTALTITLPAVAAQFHYITALDIVLYSAAARVGAAAPTVVTTTNLPGAVAFTFSTAGAIGTTDVQDLIRVTPLRSSTVNTATTIVCPIAAGGIWRITATYFTGT